MSLLACALALTGVSASAEQAAPAAPDGAVPAAAAAAQEPGPRTFTRPTIRAIRIPAEEAPVIVDENRSCLIHT